jgi:signal transduction histidine kinase
MKPSELRARARRLPHRRRRQARARRGGLGLPLARQLIEAHGGRLDMQSEKGAGTTATISLP